MGARSIVKQVLHSGRVPDSARQTAMQARDRMRVATSGWRALPDFLILGIQKGGTTALYDYLIGHPQVVSALNKEVHYFDNRYDGEQRTYRFDFPFERRMESVARRHGRAITGEATPFYLSGPHIPERVADMLPDVKLIALLREPVSRAFSAFHHNRRRTPYEPLTSFADAVERELTELSNERELLTADPGRSHHRYAYHCYLNRGVYADQLLRWYEVFPRERLLVVQSERLASEPGPTFARVLEFLELDPWRPPSFPPSNANRYPDIDPALAERLREYFHPHNRRLFDLLGEELDWSGAPGARTAQT